MPSTTEFSKAAQDQILEGIRQSQNAAVEAVKIWAKAVEKVTPAIPAVSVPFADELPKPAQIVESAFDFAQKLLVAQREFTLRVLEAATPAFAPKASNGTKPAVEKH